MHDLKMVWNRSLHKYYFNIIYKISNWIFRDRCIRTKFIEFWSSNSVITWHKKHKKPDVIQLDVNILMKIGWVNIMHIYVHQISALFALSLIISFSFFSLTRAPPTDVCMQIRSHMSVNGLDANNCQDSIYLRHALHNNWFVMYLFFDRE